MICPDCGKELSESALFCRYCGVSIAAAEKKKAESAAIAVRKSVATEQLATTAAITAEEFVATKQPATTAAAAVEESIATEQPAITAAIAEEPAASEQPATTAAAAEEPAASEQPAATTAVAEEPAASEQPAEVIDTGTSAPAKKRSVRHAFISLLLFFIFAGGLTISGFFMFKTWKAYHTPYQEEAYASLDEQLARSEDCAEKISEYEALIRENARKTRELMTTLARYQMQREEEVMNSAASDELDLDALFKTDFFASAYQQYAEDLLSAFRQDALMDSWLYPYYSYSAACGTNPNLDRDLWIYDNDAEEEKFSGLLDSQYFCSNVYTAVLSDHFTRNGHLYVTGLDMLNVLFQIPGYVLDDAVFVKAYGGNPSPGEMEVPGWSQQDYHDFWESVESRTDSPYAVWEDFGLSALDFDIDWNMLVDENAYYRAYEKFMKTIAPGLDRYDKAQYIPDDDYYGGVRYELPGGEAALSDIAAAYIAEHPDYITERGIDTETLPSSYDSLIAESQLRLQELADTAEELSAQISEEKRLQNSIPFFQQQREKLTVMEKRHTELLTRTLWGFALICVFLFLMTLASLRRFIRALR